MSFSVGIVGLPNVGKSTLFKALTKKEVKIEPRPFTTIEPNIGVVFVPDQRLEKLSSVIKPEKITPTTIEFLDIAGLIEGAHKGEGLGNQFLSQIKNCKAVLKIIRTFNNPEVENVLKEINPKKELAVLETELLMKDLESLEKALVSLERKQDKESIEKSVLFKKIKEQIAKGKSVSKIDLTEKEREIIKEYQFLSAKPSLTIFNGSDKKQGVAIDLKEEQELAELSEKDKTELGMESQLDLVIKACYQLLNLITFFTVAGSKEIRAWTIKRDSSVLEAARTVHSDFKEKFIKAEVINWEKLCQSDSWSKAKEKGLITTAGKDYIVKDGDVIEFKI